MRGIWFCLKDTVVMVTLTIAGNYPYPWGTVVPSQLELRHMFHSGLDRQDSKFEFWEPSVVDFQSVSGAKVIVGSVDEFLTLIERQPPFSIVKINVFSHGGRGKISFRGRIDINKGDVFLNEVLELGDLIATPLEQRVKRLRDRFFAGAEMVFFMCRAGSDVGMLKEISDAFGVTVKGFREFISYCPLVEESAPPSPTTYKLIDRNRIGTDGCDGQIESDPFKLMPNMTATYARYPFGRRP